MSIESAVSRILHSKKTVAAFGGLAVALGVTTSCMPNIDHLIPTPYAVGTITPQRLPTPTLVPPTPTRTAINETDWNKLSAAEKVTNLIHRKGPPNATKLDLIRATIDAHKALFRINPQTKDPDVDLVTGDNIVVAIENASRGKLSPAGITAMKNTPYTIVGGKILINEIANEQKLLDLAKTYADFNSIYSTSDLTMVAVHNALLLSLIELQSNNLNDIYPIKTPLSFSIPLNPSAINPYILDTITDLRFQGTNLRTGERVEMNGFKSATNNLLALYESQIMKVPYFMSAPTLRSTQLLSNLLSITGVTVPQFATYARGEKSISELIVTMGKFRNKNNPAIAKWTDEYLVLNTWNLINLVNLGEIDATAVLADIVQFFSTKVNQLNNKIIQATDQLEPKLESLGKINGKKYLVAPESTTIVLPWGINPALYAALNGLEMEETKS